MALASWCITDLRQRLLAQADRVGGLAVVVAEDRAQAQRERPRRTLWRGGDRAVEDRVGLDDLRDVDEEALRREHRAPDDVVRRAPPG